MFPKLLDGDIVFVRKQPVARNDQENVLGILPEEVRLVILTSENP
ncbi:hypothetical protein [Mesotoga sp.]